MTNFSRAEVCPAPTPAGASLSRSRRRARLWLVVVAVALLAACEVPNPQPGDTLPADYVAPPVDDIRAGLSYGPDPAQLVDLYLPTDPSGPVPVVVWVHPGGWMTGTRSVVPELVLRQVDRKGWAVASVDYRLVAWNGTQYVNTHPTASYDIDRFVRWLKANAVTYGIDPNRIILFGGSAGAQLASLAGVAPGLHVDPTLPPALLAQSPAVAGVVAGSAPLDLEYMVGASANEAGFAKALLGCLSQPCDPVLVRSASPRHQLRADSAPMYVAAGGLDTLVPPPSHAAPFVSDYRSVVTIVGGVTAKPIIRYDLVEQGDHNLDHANINMRHLELFLDLVGS